MCEIVCTEKEADCEFCMTFDDWAYMHAYCTEYIGLESDG